MNEQLLGYLSDAIEQKIFNLLSFRGYVTEKDICEIIQNESGISLEGSEEKVYRAEDLV